MAKVPCAMLQAGVVVTTSGGPRQVTSAGEYESYGMPMWGWRWTPAPRPDGLADCGYSGVHVDVAPEQLVELVLGAARKVRSGPYAALEPVPGRRQA
jgi:hypothetical protein